MEKVSNPINRRIDYSHKQSCHYCLTWHICLSGQYYSIYGPALENTTDIFSSSAVYIATFITVNTRLQGKFFGQFKSCFPVSGNQLYYVFNNRVLVSDYGWKSRVMAIASIIMNTTYFIIIIYKYYAI